MPTVALRLKRSVKYWFVRLSLHRLTGVLSPVFFHLYYLTLFSRWCSEHRDIPYREFHPPLPDNRTRTNLYRFLLDHEHLDGAIDYLEFGVASGDSIRWWVENNRDPASRFVGFDTFVGLPDDWGAYKKGHFSTGSKTPDVGDDRCAFETGIFQDTLRPFLERFAGTRRKVIHIDSDLYTSALYVLNTLAPYMNKDDVIIFDEFGVPTHEFRAVMDFFGSHRLRYAVLGAVNNYLQVGLKIL